MKVNLAAKLIYFDSMLKILPIVNDLVNSYNSFF